MIWNEWFIFMDRECLKYIISYLEFTKTILYFTSAWFEVKGVFLFYWYLWNYWPSQFKLSFHYLYKYIFLYNDFSLNLMLRLKLIKLYYSIKLVQCTLIRLHLCQTKTNPNLCQCYVEYLSLWCVIVHIPTSPKQSQGWTICSSHFVRAINIYTCKKWNNGSHLR